MAGSSGRLANATKIGSDNRAWQRLKGQILVLNIGTGQQENKVPVAQWLLHVLGYNTKLEVLPICNKSYSTEITRNVSPKNHKAIEERVAQLAIQITNSYARLCSQENE